MVQGFATSIDLNAQSIRTAADDGVIVDVNTRQLIMILIQMKSKGELRGMALQAAKRLHKDVAETLTDKQHLMSDKRAITLIVLGHYRDLFAEWSRDLEKKYGNYVYEGPVPKPVVAAHETLFLKRSWLGTVR